MCNLKDLRYFGKYASATADNAATAADIHPKYGFIGFTIRHADNKSTPSAAILILQRVAVRLAGK